MQKLTGTQHMMYTQGAKISHFQWQKQKNNFRTTFNQPLAFGQIILSHGKELLKKNIYVKKEGI